MTARELAVEQYEVEIFDVDGDNPRLRWTAPGAPLVERRLNRDEVDELATLAADEYRVRAPELSAIGSALYRWLDGPTERWLQTARNRQQPLLLRLGGEERLRGLPWELLFDKVFLSVHPHRAVTPVRTASTRKAGPFEVANRPLRMLFMACSPLDVEPVLDFEGEEAAILNASAGQIDAVVEETGSLRGLNETLTWFGSNHFDVVHLSGHAIIDSSDVPRLMMEDDHGQRNDASAADIADALHGAWPRLLFVSGCSTANSPAAGHFASMAEALIDAGAPAVLGWALKIGDTAASLMTAKVYQGLSDGQQLPDAVASSRRELFNGSAPEWHLLRMYADQSPLTALVTAKGTRGRTKLCIPKSTTNYLDGEQRTPVADRASFVGRRRELQALLRDLRPADPASGPQIALIHGMGGLGKSSLANRVLDRIRLTHPHRAVHTGKVDVRSIAPLFGRLELDPLIDRQVNELLADERPLPDRLRFILDGPLADLACVFVFDDFESGNLEEDGTGGFRCMPESLEVLTAFATAIGRTASPSRVLVTSRYVFPLPPDVRAVRLGISQLQDADLEKKLRLTEHLESGTVDVNLRQRAITAAAGIPRLLERLDKLIGTELDSLDDLDAAIAAIEDAELGYREGLLLKKLLKNQTNQVRRTLCLAATYEIAVPAEAIAALSPGDPIETEIAAATAVGLLQSGLHPTSGEVRYLVSPLLRPLLEGLAERLSDEEIREAQSRRQVPL